MRMRLHVTIFLLVACLFCPAVAGAGDVYEIKAGATPSGRTYPTLEALREAIDAGVVTLHGGDTIVLHNDDKSLTDSLLLDGYLKLFLKSADGKRYRIERKDGLFSDAVVFADGANPNLTVDSVHLVGPNASSGIRVDNALYDGKLAVNNSIIEKTYDGIFTNNGMDISITNTIIEANAYAIRTEGSGDLNLNIIMDSNADAFTKWTGDINTSNLFAGSQTITADIAAGKKLTLDGDLETNYASFTKTGAGAMRLENFRGNRIAIDQGRLEFGVGWSSATTLTVGREGILKVAFHPGNVIEYLEQEDIPGEMPATAIALTSHFFSEEGARTEIQGISMWPTMPRNAYHGESNATSTVGKYMIFVPVGTTRSSTMASTMSIDNKLLKATWKAGDSTKDNVTDAESAKLEDKDCFFLHIEKVNNLDILDGVGSYADAYRMRDDLSEAERDMLDTIYCTGGVGSSAGFLQTVGGVIVQNSLIAMRHNQANLINKINRRVTDYQKEELFPTVTGSEICYYSDEDPLSKYGEIWASIDQSWMTQRDIGSLAGYRYNTHGVTIGYDWHRDHIIFGGALNYESGEMKLKSQSSTKNDIQTLIAAVYGSWAYDGWYVSGTGVAGYGWNDTESAYRLIGIDPMTGKTGNYSTTTLAANLEVGYMYETEFLGFPLRLTPYGSLTYGRIHRSAVRESGADYLNHQFYASSLNLWEGGAGVRIAVPIERGDSVWIPNIDAAFIRSNGDSKNPSADIGFIDRTSAGWGVSVLGKNRSAIRISGGLDARVRQNLVLGASYEMEWRDHYWKNQLNVKASLEF